MIIQKKEITRFVYTSEEEIKEEISRLEKECETLRFQLSGLIEGANISKAKKNYLNTLTGRWHGLWSSLYKDTLPIRARSIRRRIKTYNSWIKRLTP